ncbi:MAG: hypothetical protein KF795_13390 [Labilithrix sp.]|nr:hypothetical protein [Labilithrix sp.]
MAESAPELDPSGDDPFARMASALREEQAPARGRPTRRSRPSFSDLAPVLPPTPAPPRVSPAPAVVVNQVHIVGDAEPSEVASQRLSFIPTVIVADDPPSFSISHPAAPHPRAETPTTRKVRRGAPPSSGIGASTVLFLLAVSLTVFGLGVAALVYSRSADAPLAAPRSNAAVAPATAATD